MSETGPPLDPLTARLQERDEKEAERYSDFLVSARHQLTVEMETLGAGLVKQQRRILDDMESRYNEHAESSRRSFDAERERIEQSYRSVFLLLRKRAIVILLSFALATLAIYGTVIGLARWEADRIEDRLDQLTSQRDYLQEVVNNLSSETWGITLDVTEEGYRQVTLPVGTEQLRPNSRGQLRVIVPQPPETTE